MAKGEGAASYKQEEMLSQQDLNEALSIIWCSPIAPKYATERDQDHALCIRN